MFKSAERNALLQPYFWQYQLAQSIWMGKYWNLKNCWPNSHL